MISCFHGLHWKFSDDSLRITLNERSKDSNMLPFLVKKLLFFSFRTFFDYEVTFPL